MSELLIVLSVLFLLRWIITRDDVWAWIGTILWAIGWLVR